MGKHCTQKFYIISIHYMTIFHSADFTFDWFPGMLIKIKKNIYWENENKYVTSRFKWGHAHMLLVALISRSYG